MQTSMETTMNQISLLTQANKKKKREEDTPSPPKTGQRRDLHHKTKPKYRQKPMRSIFSKY
jgi:hypothetical protein